MVVIFVLLVQVLGKEALLRFNYRCEIKFRDFQKLNSSPCGMGIPARPILRAGRMPNAAVLQRGEPPQQTSAPPQENFEDLFMCKSLIPILYEAA